MEGNLRFGVGIPLYHPTAAQLRNLNKYASLFEQVYVFDNTEGGISPQDRQSFLADKRFIYLSTGQNEGLSHAYNCMCQWADKVQLDFLALYDQDTTPSEHYIRKLQHHIIADKAIDVAVYGPVICKYKGAHEEISELRDVDVLISSGSFLNLHIYRKLSGFDEAYFIDKVDDDYCLMARQHGYRVVQVMDCLLVHRIGNLKKIFGKEIEQHSPLRMYYIVRNTMYMRRKYGKSLFGSLYWFVDKIRHIILYDDDKMAKIYMMICGLKDFLQLRTGKKTYNE